MRAKKPPDGPCRGPGAHVGLTRLSTVFSEEHPAQLVLKFWSAQLAKPRGNLTPAKLAQLSGS